MKLQRQLLNLFTSVYLIANCAIGQAEPLADVTGYSFNQSKLDTAETPFNFLRSYVDYYYLLMKKNKVIIPFVNANWNVSAWCAGDAHPENFGVLLKEDGSSVFTINDMDDAGPCPAVLELFRLMVSSRLYDKETQSDKLLEAYVLGLQNKDYMAPEVIQDMLKKSQKKGANAKTNKISNNKFIRENGATNVTAIEGTQIKLALKDYFLGRTVKAEILDIMSNPKTGGGSGGLSRYELLVQDQGKLIHLQLKELVSPSLTSVASAIVPAAENRITEALRYEQVAGYSSWYGIVMLKEKTLTISPVFAGNVEVKLDKNQDSENVDLIRYEAYTLGMLHSKSISDVSYFVDAIGNYSRQALEADVQTISNHFEEKFSHLKNH